MKTYPIYCHSARKPKSHSGSLQSAININIIIFFYAEINLSISQLCGTFVEITSIVKSQWLVDWTIRPTNNFYSFFFSSRSAQWVQNERSSNGTVQRTAMTWHIFHTAQWFMQHFVWGSKMPQCSASQVADRIGLDDPPTITCISKIIYILYSSIARIVTWLDKNTDKHEHFHFGVNAIWLRRGNTRL